MFLAHIKLIYKKDITIKAINRKITYPVPSYFIN